MSCCGIDPGIDDLCLIAGTIFADVDVTHDIRASTQIQHQAQHALPENGPPGVHANLQQRTWNADDCNNRTCLDLSAKSHSRCWTSSGRGCTAREARSARSESTRQSAALEAGPRFTCADIHAGTWRDLADAFISTGCAPAYHAKRIPDPVSSHGQGTGSNLLVLDCAHVHRRGENTT